MEQPSSIQTINLKRQSVGQKRRRVVHFVTHEQELNPKMDCLTSIKQMDEEEDVTLTEVGRLTSSEYTVCPRKGVQHHMNTYKG